MFVCCHIIFTPWTGSVACVREQLDKFISEAVSSDVHVMMCELLDNFTLVLPLCSADIQRDCEFNIPNALKVFISRWHNARHIYPTKAIVIIF